MAITRGTTENQNPVGADPECLQNKSGIYPTAAHDSDFPQIAGWKFLPAPPRSIRTFIGTPVTQKHDDLRFKPMLRHYPIKPLNSENIARVEKCLEMMAPLGQAAAHTPHPLHMA